MRQHSVPENSEGIRQVAHLDQPSDAFASQQVSRPARIETLRRSHQPSHSIGPSPMTLGTADDEQLNLHIVGPAVTGDSHVLTDYLSKVPGVKPNARVVIPVPPSSSRPVLFTLVQKQPLGIVDHRSPAAKNLEIIEKLVEPHCADVLDEYFRKINPCLPLLDEAQFRRQHEDNKSNVSPALLACIYAHTIVYWQHSSTSGRQSFPDSRFIWNLANEATYSELHLSPGMSIVQALILNLGGRPTTSLIGNGVQLGSAVSMAHSLGLNHSPLPWNIPQSEKFSRMKIWWALLVHDRWSSLTHGTPPHISKAQYDVPAPRLEHLCSQASTEDQKRTASVFIALVSLTDVLDRHLQHIYNLGKDKAWSTTNLELSLNNWVDSLAGSIRMIIIRGTRLDTPGAANLRLAYLTARLLMQRIELEAERQVHGLDEETMMNRYVQARRSCEDILVLTQELQSDHLGDFWLSISAFAFPTTVNFLLRCAVETENISGNLNQSIAFKIAADLVTALRGHQKDHGWDLGDICLSQHADVIDTVVSSANNEVHSGDDDLGMYEFLMSDANVLDQFLPSLWDPLPNMW